MCMYGSGCKRQSVCLAVSLILTFKLQYVHVRDPCAHTSPFLGRTLDLQDVVVTEKQSWSSPQHHFLKLILSDLSSKQLRKNRKLRQFLLDFILILCNVIPHNLHDEIFQIMQQVLALC